MAYDYDEQLIEAMGARRKRLAQALMYGPQRLMRRWTDRLGTHLASAFVAVLICAGCVAVSFVSNLLANDPSLRHRTSTSPTAPASSPPGPATADSPTSTPARKAP